MKSEFVDYLKSIGMTDPLIEKINEIYEFYENILKKNLNDEILDIFVTDFINADKTRQYENVWFFSRKYFMEAKLFIQQNNFDIFPVKKDIAYLEIQKKNYDFKKANEESRLNLRYSVQLKGEGRFKASKENCDYLMKIFYEYMLPNLTI